MGWILQCLLWVTLASTSAYNNYRSYQPYFDYTRTDGHIRRVDYEPTHEDLVDGLTQERQAEGQGETQRMSERSISVSSGIQAVQNKERKRIHSWVEDVLPVRPENGTYKIVNAHVNVNVNFPTISTRRGAVDESRPSDSVVFPGRTSAQKFEPMIPKDCLEIGICENIPNYPHDVVNNIISKLGDKLDRFKVEALEEPEIAQRIGPDDSAEIDLCLYQEKIIKPQAAKGKNGNWYVILNNKDNPLQGYRVEICHSRGTNCAENIAYFYGGYTGKCKQKYVQRTMAAVDVDKEQVLYDIPFKVPSCCSCVAVHTGG